MQEPETYSEDDLTSLPKKELIELIVSLRDKNEDMLKVSNALQSESIRIREKYEEEIAVLKKNLDQTVRVILKNVANIDIEAFDGWAPLHFAVREGHQDIVEDLLIRGAKVDVVDDNNQTSLQLAAAKGHEGITKVLLNYKAKIDAKAKDGTTALHEAAFYGHENIIEILLNKGAKIDAVDERAWTSLHCAVQQGQEEATKVLLLKGANVNFADKDGRTPLHWSAQKGYENIVNLLLENNANVNAANQEGITPLHIAANIGIVKSLLKYGAIFDIKNREGKTLTDLSNDREVTDLLKLIDELFKDAEKGNVEVINKLKTVKLDEFFALTNARNSQGNGLLQVAIVNKHKNIASKLLEMLMEPGQIQSQCSPEDELEQLKKLKNAAELHMEFSELYLPVLRNNSKPYGSEENIARWIMLKEGSYYLGNAYKLVEAYKNCVPGLIEDKNIETVNDTLRMLGFVPKHISSGYTDEAYGGEVKCFVSKGQGTKYYELLHSEWKKDVRSFIKMVELNIDIPVKIFLKTIKQRLQSISSEK